MSTPHDPGAVPGTSLDLSKLVTISAWVVVGLYTLAYLHGLARTGQYEGDVGDRFFGGMTTLGTGLFYGGVLLAVGVWLRRQDGR